jgi:hypothetical protein
MAKITQKQFIEQLRELKEIKPRQEWVVLAKSQLFNENPAVERIIKNPVRRTRVFDAIIFAIFKRKLAYSFATLVFVIIGLVGFAQYTMPGDLLFPVRKIAEQSEAALTGHSGVKQSLVTLNNRINDLALATKEGKKDNIPSAINEINTNVSELTKSLKDNPTEDPQTLKEIVVSLKTLADVPGTDLTQSQGIKDLYQAVVKNQITDLEKSALTEDQETALNEVKDLYIQEKYIEALEKILTITN